MNIIFYNNNPKRPRSYFEVIWKRRKKRKRKINEKKERH